MYEEWVLSKENINQFSYLVCVCVEWMYVCIYNTYISIYLSNYLSIYEPIYQSLAGLNQFKWNQIQSILSHLILSDLILSYPILPIYLSVCPSAWLPACVSVCLLPCLLAWLLACLPLWLAGCLSIYLSIYPYISRIKS